MKVSEELKKELSNAFAAYKIVLNAASLGCEVFPKFEGFKHIEPEEVNRRLQLLQDFFNKL